MHPIMEILKGPKKARKSLTLKDFKAFDRKEYEALSTCAAMVLNSH
jgi:hypothetical protein